MKENEVVNIDDETINNVGLLLSDKQINASTAKTSRVFEYPHLDNVFIMESDLYGNTMPKDSCFIAFEGQHGLVGKHLTVEILKNASIDEIKNIVEHHNQA